MSEQCMHPLPLLDGSAFCFREKGHFGPHRFPLLGALDTPTDTTSGGEREALRAENERLRKALEEIDQIARAALDALAAVEHGEGREP